MFHGQPCSVTFPPYSDRHSILYALLRLHASSLGNNSGNSYA